MPRLAGYGVRLLPGTAVREFTAGGAVCSRDGKELVLDGFDAVVLALGSASHNPLEQEARRVLSEVYVIGDAARPGKLLDVTRQALQISASL
jgi:hypothetical protein